jgi:hypothetical protein
VRSSDCSACDCEFVALAMRLETRLVTSAGSKGCQHARIKAYGHLLLSRTFVLAASPAKLRNGFSHATARCGDSLAPVHRGFGRHCRCGGSQRGGDLSGTKGRRNRLGLLCDRHGSSSVIIGAPKTLSSSARSMPCLLMFVRRLVWCQVIHFQFAAITVFKLLW